MVAIVVAEEFQRVWSARNRSEKPGVASLDFFWQKRRVGAYYFYILDPDFGPAFIKICTYGPWFARVWVNGHEWAKRQATKAGIAFTALSNGFASCDRARSGCRRSATPSAPSTCRRSLIAGSPRSRRR